MKDKKYIAITLFFVAVFVQFFGIFNSPTTSQATSQIPASSQLGMYQYSGEIPHFFTHQIINDPEKAFSKKLAKHYDKDCITHTELENFLNEMYKNGYALVDIYDVVGYKNGEPYFKDVFLPMGKKPFLLSFDDMSYDSIGLGLSDKIILDQNGEIASFTQSNTPQIEYNKEAFCIIENFIKNHPDFSINNARAIICPTGYDGILGYRINKDGYNREKDIENIKPLIEKLKSMNYRFASHTYGHIQVTYVSDSQLARDCEKYHNEIESVIGKTDILSFPCGNYISSGSKLDILNEYGFKIFFCVGDAKTCQKNGSIFLKREVLDGHSLRCFRNEYLQFFDTKNVYDHEHRTIPFP